MDKNEQVRIAKGLAKWFSIDLTIKIFGVTILRYHFPPEENLQKID